MIRRLNESRKDEVLKMTDTYRKYITRCKNLLDHIERDWDDFAAYLETTNGTNQYYDDIDSKIYELSKAFSGLDYLQLAIRNVLGKPVEKVWESRHYKRGRDIRERRQRMNESDLFIDMWNGDEFNTRDYAVDCQFYPNDGVYRGNIYRLSDGRMVGDYSCSDSVVIETQLGYDFG